MSFKGLTARAAAAMKPEPDAPAKSPPATETPEADARKLAASKPKAS